MRFKIAATTGLVKDVQGFDADKFRCQWGEVRPFLKTYQDITHIDIDTIDELVALSKVCEIIVNEDSIEIYNDYRE